MGIAIVKAVLRIVARAADRAALELDDEPALILALAEAAGTAAATAPSRDAADGVLTNAPRKRLAALIQTDLGLFSIHAATCTLLGPMWSGFSPTTGTLPLMCRLSRKRNRSNAPLKRL